MTLIRIIAFLAAVADFVLCGLLSNGFITAVLITEWARSRSLPASEQLLLSLGVSNISVTFASFPTFFILGGNIFSNFFIFPNLLYNILILWVAFLRYWLTAWLFVFYCIKILNSTHSFFLWWKMRISRSVFHLIMGSCIISFFSSFSLVLSIFGLLLNNGTANNTNTANKEILEVLSKVFTSFFFILGSSCPFLLVSLCSLLVVAFLCRHVSRMTSKGSNFRSLQTEAPVKAASTVLSLLFLYISYYVAQIVFLTLKPDMKQASFQVVSPIIMVYSPVQGAILVLSNPKLKQTALAMLARLKSQPSHGSSLILSFSQPAE